ncbi:hypothetical protein ACFQ4N_02825 [Oceanobacillus iheyensis]|uniref:hypothetical protein n=1 Tax=Oceanobacillus iheyensis TaxID=182710 RepID=UPI00363BCE72
MENVKAFGVFEKQGNYIFRNSAYLQWGTKEESIGSFLLLNPGNAKPSIGNIEQEITGEQSIQIDATMRQMIKLVEKIRENKQLEGRVQIYNLFSLRNPKSDKAILEYEDLVESRMINPKETIPSVEELQKHPWVCCGWGVNTEKRYKHLQEIKSLWKNRLAESGILYFGKLHENGLDYRHLKPMLTSQQDQLLKDLLKIYNTSIMNRAKIVESELI